MKLIAAYLLLSLSKPNPSVDDIKSLLDTVGIETDAERAQKLAQDSNVALETYQKQVNTLEERNISLMKQQAQLYVIWFVILRSRLFVLIVLMIDKMSCMSCRKLLIRCRRRSRSSRCRRLLRLRLVRSLLRRMRLSVRGR